MHSYRSTGQTLFQWWTRPIASTILGKSIPMASKQYNHTVATKSAVHLTIKSLSRSIAPLSHHIAYARRLVSQPQQQEAHSPHALGFNSTRARFEEGSELSYGVFGFEPR